MVPASRGLSGIPKFRRQSGAAELKDPFQEWQGAQDASKPQDPFGQHPTFSEVDQFAAMRDGMGIGGFSPTIPQAPRVLPDYTTVGTALGAGHFVGDGHNHGGGSLSAAVANVDVGPKFQELQSQFPGLRHTSGYRDPEHNRKVGGVPNSYHTQKDAHGHARANDYVGNLADMQAAQAWAKQQGAREALIHNAGSGVHLHVAWKHTMGQSGVTGDEAMRGMSRHQRPGSVLPWEGVQGRPKAAVHHLL